MPEKGKSKLVLGIYLKFWKNRNLSVCGFVPFGDASRPHTLKLLPAPDCWHQINRPIALIRRSICESEWVEKMAIRKAPPGGVLV